MSNKFKAGEEAKLPPTPPVELRQASPMLTEAQISVSLIAGYFFSPLPPHRTERERAIVKKWDWKEDMRDFS